MSFTIIPTSKAEHIARNIDTGNIRVVYPGGNKDGERFFPDGEVYSRIPEIESISGRTVVLHSGSPNPNKGIVELEQILGILKIAGVQPLEVFFLYMPYGMQDHAFRVGEINAAEVLVNKLMRYYGVTQIYTIDAHFFGRNWVKNYPIQNLSALPFLEAAARREFPELQLISADLGSERRTNLKGAKKERHNSYDVTVSADSGFAEIVKGKIVGVVDDIIETGGTLDRLYDTCKKSGAVDVVTLITHGVLYSGIERISRKYKRVYLTNTLASPASNVDITSLVISTLQG